MQKQKKIEYLIILATKNCATVVEQSKTKLLETLESNLKKLVETLSTQ